MKIYTYDNTFEGFLTCVFDCYSRKDFPVDICSRFGEQRYLFVESIDVPTNPKKAERVWKGIQKHLSGKNKQLLFYAYLSEELGIEMKIYRFLRRMFSGHLNLETDYGDPDVLSLTQSSQKVKKEAMRLMQFVRFQRTKDHMYFCGIEPKYDVLPLIINHYQKRFTDQKWLIYDLRRNYGVYYGKDKVEEVVLTKKQFNTYNGQVKQALLAEGEDFYQKLWRSYFKHINIEERKNLKLQRQHMPRRFWRYLPEKQHEV
ncbi:TIGR03915 family putative DNA repair protein [uncultured Draconibacterium sp.]|uniref:TIGR03915 family putative DNA repair protein n=1 Tax=uncultured Draconibacterium sp. TaxID=1573823 RepID=UPI003260CA6F